MNGACCAAATRPSGRSAWSIIPPPLTPLRCRCWDCASARARRSDGSPAPPAVCGPHTACRVRRRSRHREITPPWFRPPWPRSRACRFRPWIRVRSRRLRRATPRPSASPHDRRSRNRPETAPRVQRSPSRSPLPSNWLFEVSRRGSESRSLALVPAARKAPATFSLWRARISRGQRARSVTFCLWTAARIDARVCRCSGFNLRDVFPTGCVAGRAEGAARSPGRGLRRGAELDRSRPQPVVDGVERFNQPVVPCIAPVEQRDLCLIGFTKEELGPVYN